MLSDKSHFLYRVGYHKFKFSISARDVFKYCWEFNILILLVIEFIDLCRNISYHFGVSSNSVRRLTTPANTKILGNKLNFWLLIRFWFTYYHLFTFLLGFANWFLFFKFYFRLMRFFFFDLLLKIFWNFRVIVEFLCLLSDESVCDFIPMFFIERRWSDTWQFDV